MLKWMNGIYIGRGMKRSALRKTKADLNAGRPVFGKYLITLGMGEHSQLEIVNTANLIQKTVCARTPMIVGAANDYDDAVQLVIKITEDVLKETGDADIRKYFEEK